MREHYTHTPIKNFIQDREIALLDEENKILNAIKVGKKENQIKTAQKILNEDMEITLIAKITGLSVKKINTLNNPSP